jgi:pSer/pThr/pTyr-binding forkhead associated (FHA) protein
LVASSGSDRGRTFELHLGDSTVGRGRECDIRLGDETVSRRQALLRINADRVAIEDLGSSNGTLVDGTKIAGPTEVNVGQEIGLGEVRLRLDVVGPVRGTPGVDNAV